MHHINTIDTSCKTLLISHATTWLIAYNQTSCLLTQHCPPHGHILEINIEIIILMGMMQKMVKPLYVPASI